RPRRDASSLGRSSRTRSAATSRMCSRPGSARKRKPPLLRNGDAHGEAPRPARREQLVRVHVLEPADEVLLGFLVGGAVNGASLGLRRALPVVAAFERRFALFAGRTLQVSTRHGFHPSPTVC